MMLSLYWWRLKSIRQAKVTKFTPKPAIVYPGVMMQTSQFLDFLRFYTRLTEPAQRYRLQQMRLQLNRSVIPTLVNLPVLYAFQNLTTLMIRRNVMQTKRVNVFKIRFCQHSGMLKCWWIWASSLITQKGDNLTTSFHARFTGLIWPLKAIRWWMAAKIAPCRYKHPTIEATMSYTGAGQISRGILMNL